MRAHIDKIFRYVSIAVIVVGCAYILKPGIDKYVEHRNEEKRLEAEIRDLEAERARLEKQMRALKEEDPEYIERLAREKLHMSKPDETVFRFKKKQ